jgi:carbonic anhydrase
LKRITVSQLSSDQALQMLMEGNQRYVEMKQHYPNQSVERRAEVAEGQKPFASILSCSDSRVPAEIIFDQGLGDLFLVRVAGNILSEVLLASLEFSTKVLGTPLVMVLGHSKCGAVAATLDAIENGWSPPGHLDSLVETIKPAAILSQNQPGKWLDNAIRANVLMTVGQLKSSAPILIELVREGKLKIVGAVYDLDSGCVEIVT